MSNNSDSEQIYQKIIENKPDNIRVLDNIKINMPIYDDTKTRWRMYFFVRTDLRMGIGKVGTQIGHAASRLARRVSYIIWDEYIQDLELKYVYGVQGDFPILRDDSVTTFIEVIKDAGITQVAPNTITIMGVFTKQDLRHKFKLLK